MLLWYPDAHNYHYSSYIFYCGLYFKTYKPEVYTHDYFIDTYIHISNARCKLSVNKVHNQFPHNRSIEIRMALNTLNNENIYHGNV